MPPARATKSCASLYETARPARAPYFPWLSSSERGSEALMVAKQQPEPAQRRASSFRSGQSSFAQDMPRSGDSGTGSVLASSSDVIRDCTVLFPDCIRATSLAAKMAEGYEMDPKLWAGLWLIERNADG